MLLEFTHCPFVGSKWFVKNTDANSVECFGFNQNFS